MKSLVRVCFVFPLFLSLFGCGADRNAGGGEGLMLGGAEYIFVNKGTLTTTDGLSGTGSVVFKDPRADEDSNYALSFTLQPGGSLILITNANSKLGAGVGMKFGRGDGDVLLVTLLDGAQTTDLSPDFDGQKADGTISLSVDVHGHGHLVVFKNGQEYPYTFNSRPKGRLWGLQLDKTTVSSASAGAPIDEH